MVLDKSDKNFEFIMKTLTFVLANLNIDWDFVEICKV